MKKTLNALRYFLLDIFKQRKMLLELTKNDLKSRYAGSVFGVFWAYVQPLVTLLVFWFVFQVGFKNSPVDNIEFILWLMAAYIPWVYYNDVINSSSMCLYEYGYLVKKVRFRTSLIPLVKVLSATFIHVFFIFFIFLAFEVYGYHFEWIWLQSLYYSFATFCLTIGIAWIVAAFSVFFKDFSQLVSIVLQIHFWMTPIFWATDSMSAPVLRILQFNPLYYIADGYRNSFIYCVPFWQHPMQTAYFWGFTLVIFVLGAITYHRLRPHFADIL